MKKTFYVQGMHCASCELLIKSSLEEIPWTKVTAISAKKGIVETEFTKETDIKKIKEHIQKNGYKVSEESTVSDKKIARKHIGIGIVFILILGFVFKKTDVLQYLPSGNHISLGIAFLTGIIASVSTCFALIGSIVLGFSEYTKDNKTTSTIKVHSSFHIGRIVGFFVLGSILWLIGKTLSLSPSTTSIITIIIGIIVIWMGLHALHILPSISSLGFHLPKKRTEKTLTTKNPIFAPIIWALTFFLPCWFTLSMQLVAISSWSFWQGGLIMAMFALGTMPVLFWLGLGSSYIKEKKFLLLETFIWTLIVFFGLFMISNSRQLLGIQNTPSQRTSITTGNYKRIEVAHNGYQLIPETITLEAGKNYEVVITPNSDGKWCMINMVIPKLDTTVRPIKKDQPIIYHFTNIQKWTYTIVCWVMGMYQGQIVVK